MKPDTILVLDFGGQYCHLLGRRVRDDRVYSEIVPYDINSREILELRRRFSIKGIILSGGPSSIYEAGSPQIDRRILQTGIPVLGICYGHQLIANLMGGRVKRAKEKEYGTAIAKIEGAGGILKGLGKREKIWMSHGDTVLELPDDFEVLASTDNCPIAAFRHKSRPIYGVQWHPEVAHTENGGMVLKNFIFEICGCKKNWNVGNLTEEYTEQIKREIGKEKAIVGLSGGIDSSTATVLASRAISKNLTAVFVDTGLMRQDEPEEVEKAFKKFNLNFVSVSAGDRFLRKLKGVTDPEEKRRVIGREFIKVFEEVACGTKAKYLLQGTIYPDRIESGYLKGSSKIKTHHNVGGIPKKIKFEGIVEPLKELYKDEVRKLAISIGIPKELVYRQPFPGPGLAVRIMGEVTEEKVRIAKKADAIVSQEIEKRGEKDVLWQYFAVLTDTKTTGVKGDSRAYGYVVAVRCVESKEAMTANFAKLPYETLEAISTRITNEIPEIARVVYDITNKPPSTIEWE